MIDHGGPNRRHDDPLQSLLGRLVALVAHMQLQVTQALARCHELGSGLDDGSGLGSLGTDMEM